MSDSKKNISYAPTDGLSYDPEELKYWDSAALEKELERAFELCHGCRMCFKYCDSFPTLFSLLDKKYEGDVKQITVGETAQVMDACFQCKLCEVQCPYTPRDGHEYQLDFPKLVHRYQAQKARARGVSPRDRLLGNPDLLGTAARASLGAANAANKVSAHRWLMEKAMGIHRDKLLPDFAPRTFEAEAVERGLTDKAPGEAEVVLFQTCFIQNNDTGIGHDTVEVLQKNQVSVACERGLKCCGMPAWEHGDLETVRQNAKENLKTLMPHVNAGSKVVAINPTCAMMMRKEYPELLEGEARADARKLAAAVRDPGEFLWGIRNEPRFNTDFKSSPGEQVAYHAPCHLRAQAIGFKGRDLLKKIPGVQAASVLECCGHDGTYAMKTETFEASKRIGEKAFAGVTAAEAEVWVTECPLAAVQFQQHAGKKPLHPMTVLRRAYQPDGFPYPVPAPKKDETP